MADLAYKAVRTRPTGAPALSLGFGVIDWCEEYIRQPDGPDAGTPFVFTREQQRFVVWWYAITPEGRWLHNRGVLRRPKGWGKTPLVAALALAELCGPTRFDHLDPDAAGGAVGRPTAAAWVQLAGVSEKATQITMSMVLGMCAESPIVDDYGLDLGLTRIYTAAGGKLEPITASAPTSEGARPTFIVQDETHHWTHARGGHDLDRVNRRNLGKSRNGSARMLETTNAHAVGEDSVAERSYGAYLAMTEGRSLGGALLYDSCEAPPEVDMADHASLMAGLGAAYGDSTWVDKQRLIEEIWDPSTPPEDSRRFYLNQIAAATDSWLTDPEWSARTNATRVVDATTPITLGFDGSRSRKRSVTDATALVGCTVPDGHVFEIGVWEQPPGARMGEWRVPVEQVEAAVRHAFDRYNVVGFYADPAKWETYVAEWEAKYNSRLLVRATVHHPVEWWTNRLRQMIAALEAFHGAVVDGEMSHDGSWALTRHILNARRRPTTAGVVIAKEHPESDKKIDCAIAAVLAWQARVDALAKGLDKPAVDVFVPVRIR